MTAAEDREALPPCREAPRELEALCVATRPDWGQQETWAALHACHAAGWPWDRVLKRVTALLLREGSEPRELRDEARATRPPADTGPQVFARGLAAVRAAAGIEAEARQEAGTVTTHPSDTNQGNQ